MEINFGNKTRSTSEEMIAHFRLIVEQAKKGNFSPLTDTEMQARAIVNAKGKSKAKVSVLRNAHAWVTGFDAVGEIKRTPYIGALNLPENSAVKSQIQEEAAAIANVFAEAFTLSLNSKGNSRNLDVTEKTARGSVKKIAVMLNVSPDSLLAELRSKGVHKLSTLDLLLANEIEKLPAYLHHNLNSRLQGFKKIGLPTNQSLTNEKSLLYEYGVPQTNTPSQKFNSLIEFLGWLVRLEHLPTANLRENLLPLDLFPGAFIDDINERALNIAGELAIEEFGDDIIVNQEVLSRVIVSWNNMG